MQKETHNIEVVQSVNFEFLDSLENNSTKYLLIFKRVMCRILHFKSFADNAIAVRQGGLRTIYIRQNLFHRNKLGQDVELNYLHIVLFKSPRDVKQVSTLSAQLGL